jgi:hypothetical protein
VDAGKHAGKAATIKPGGSEAGSSKWSISLIENHHHHTVAMTGSTATERTVHVTPGEKEKMKGRL